MLALRGQDLDRRLAVKFAKEKAEASRREKAAIKGAAEVGTTQAAAVVPRIDVAFSGRCSGECAPTTKRPQQRQDVDDKWRGCTTCAAFYCQKVTCQKKRQKHQEYCLMANVLDRDLFVHVRY